MAKTRKQKSKMTFKQARKSCAQKHGISKATWTCIRKNTKKAKKR